MPQIVAAMATSHGPLLNTQPNLWHLRAEADEANNEFWYRGKMYDFEALTALRQPGFAQEITADRKREHYDACMRSLDELAARFREAKPDLAIIFGNDQSEIFHEDLTGAFTVYCGTEIANRQLDSDLRKYLGPGVEVSLEGYTPPGGAIYPGAPEAALSMIDSLLEQNFDVAAASTIRSDGRRSAGIPHAYGFVYRRIMQDAPPPSIPIFTNVGVPPNTPRLPRVLQFGHAVHEALARLPKDARVALIASGGLTHFAVDEELDRQLIAAMSVGDEAMLAIPDSYLEGNTSEVKSWYVLAAIMNDLGKRMHLIDYVPCYRTAAGTGVGMGFAYWD